MPLATDFVRRYLGAYCQPYIDQLNAFQFPVKLAVGDYAAGTILGQFTSTTAANEVQTLTIGGSPTGGTYRLVFNGLTSSALAHNANAAAIQAAIDAMLGSTGLVTVGGTGPFTLTFGGKYGNQNQPLFTTINSLSGGSSPTATVAETTPGNAAGPYYAAYSDAASDGTQTAKCILPYPTSVAPDGKHYWGGSDHLEGQTAVSAYFTGTFRTEDLVGLDANAVADLGRLMSGTTSAGILRIG